MVDPLIGKVLGGYRIERLLARRRTDTVYRATQLSVARTVALRVLTAEAARDRALATAFVEGARRAGKLNHPGVVEFHEVRRQGDTIFCSLEYLPGGSLADWVEQQGPVPWGRLIPLILDTVDALHHAATLGYSHGSLDPDHLLFSQDGRLKVLDLGLAAPGSVSPRPSLEEIPTRKLHYLAPEQLRAGGSDLRADVYALGAICHFALSGSHPFGEGPREEVLATKRRHRAPRLSRIRADVPEELAAIVERMMAPAPQRRFQSFQRVRKVLAPLLDRGTRDTPPGTRRSGERLPRGAGQWPRRRGSPILWTALAGCALLVGVGFAVSSLLRNGAEEPSPPPPIVNEAPGKSPDGPPTAPLSGAPERREVDAAITRAEAARREGRYREAATALQHALAEHEGDGALLRQALEQIGDSARTALVEASRLADGHLARAEYAEAENVLRSLLPHLPADLVPEVEGKLKDLAELEGLRSVSKATNAIRRPLAELDFEAAAAILEEVRQAAGTGVDEPLGRLAKRLEAARALLEKLHAASLPEWADLDQLLREKFAGKAEVALDDFREQVLATALEAYRLGTGDRHRASLFHGTVRFPTPEEVEIVYDFSSAEQLRDFHPVGGKTDPLSVEDGLLDLEGEVRLLQGNPFQGRITVTVEIVRCNLDAPNVNVALWTTEKDRLTHGGEAVSSTGAASAGASEESADGTLDHVVFCVGYVPVEPLVDSLKLASSEGRVLFPCWAILGGKRGKTLHADLSWQCLWGQNYFKRLKTPAVLRIAWRSDGFEWSVGAAALHEEVDAGTRERLLALAARKPIGSITFLTNGERILLGSLTLAGSLNSEWLEDQLQTRAVADLERLVPGMAWSEVPHR